MQFLRILPFLLTGGPLAAQAGLSGNVYDGQGGPLLAGQVYHVLGNLVVPADETLTVQAGAAVKFKAGLRLIVDGTLDVDGAAGAPVSFGSHLDDTLGGDTFQDGPTTGSPGDWAGIEIRGGGAIDASHAIVRHAGSGGYTGVYASGGSVVLRDCTLEASSRAGIDFNALEVPAVVEGCAFVGNGGWAVDECPIEIVPGFSACSASGNALGDAIRVNSSTVGADTTIAADDVVNGALVTPHNTVIPAGVTLELQGGVGLKMEFATRLLVDGVLRTRGTAASPVVFTSLADDVHFGDTAADGPTRAGLDALPFARRARGGTVDLDGTTVRHAGSAGYTGVYASGGSIVLRNSSLERSSRAGIDFNAWEVPAVVEACALLDNGGWAVDECPIEIVPGFSGNVASGNALGDAIRINSSTVSADTTVVADDVVNGALVAPHTTVIPAGVTLELQEGVGLKMQFATRVIVDGVLRTRGTAANPVVLTSLADDVHFGDTAADGPTAGTPGGWQGIESRTGGAIDLEGAVVRFGGSSGWANIYGNGGSVALRSSRIELCSGPGIDLNDLDVPTVIVDCDVDQNAGVAIDEATLEVLDGLDSNRAAGNGGDYVKTVTGPLGAAASVGRRNLIGGVLVVPANVVVPPGLALTLDRGVVLKFQAGQLIVQGDLQVLGTGPEPVVFTAFADDDQGGDTNGDGASSGAPGSWLGVRLDPSATGVLEHALVRYAGASGWEGLRAQAPGVALRSIRSEWCASDGFRIDDALGHPVNLVAAFNGDEGIHASAGSFDLWHATSAFNGGHGFEAHAAHAGGVRNSIGWGNGAGNFTGYAPGEVQFSNGDPLQAGSNGNLDADPLFADAGTGDLRLAAGSPCEDTADFGAAALVVRDHRESSRLVSTKTGFALAADMGAYERTLFEYTVAGTPALGESLFRQVDGPNGTAVHALGALDSTLLLVPYGYVLCGFGTLVNLGSGPVGVAQELPIPVVPEIVGASVGFQAFAFGLPDFTLAHLTNVVRVAVEPALP